MAINISKLSLAELKSLHSDVAKAIVSFEKRKKKEAVAKLEKVAKEQGFTLKQLTDAKATRKSKPVAPKYANPADPKTTWSGRGRKPKWVIDALAKGKKLESLAIK